MKVGKEWLNISDLMAGLMMIFLFIGVTLMIEVQKKEQTITIENQKVKSEMKRMEKLMKKMEKLMKKSEKDKKRIKKLLEKLEELRKKTNEQKKNIIVILSEKLASNDIQVEYNAEKGTVTIAQDILFKWKEPNLNMQGKKFIQLFAKILDKNIFNNSNYKDLIKHIHIEGYASKEGSIEHNFSLSFKRAKNVWIYMTGNNITHKQIMKQKLNIVSRGEIDANQNKIDESDRKVIFRFEFYDTYNKLFKGLSK